ncbi:MAG: glycosyltransferase family 2 protein [Lachnospiraceae bacterium]|nr:glycosyltransferase family 2 protein [Lachnospiraceae bacterium]
MEYKTTDKSAAAPLLVLVVPVFNEEAVIEKSAKVLSDKVKSLAEKQTVSKGSRILFVNDGSTDNTLRIIHGLCERDPVFSVVNFAANRGHQNAILAGMMTAKGTADIVVTIDADLQQDIEAIDLFIEKYTEGCEVVYGVRNDRHSDGLAKKFTASSYYNLMKLLGADIIPNHADYRLVSSKVLDALSEYREVNLFLRGLIPNMGFRSGIVYFDVKEREAGTSKYTFKKMMRLAMDGITSFSTRPLHLIGLLGFFVVIFGIIMSIVCLVDWINGRNIPGYTTLLIVLLISTGATLLSLGVIGEYIAKIYMETKHRPPYIIDSVVWQDPAGKQGEKTSDGDE